MRSKLKVCSKIEALPTPIRDASTLTGGAPAHLDTVNPLS